MENNLYEKDYYLWIERTIHLLENNQFFDLDLENLSELEYNQRGWKNEIRNFRRAIKRIIADSPSLQPYLIEIFDNSFQEARISWLELSGIAENLVGLAPICTIEQALNEDWFPEISK